MTYPLFRKGSYYLCKVNKEAFNSINALALLAIVAGITEPIISLVDTAIVGSLGEISLAGVGIGGSFYLLLVWVLSQTKSAISSLVAKAYGADKLEESKLLIPQSLALIFGTGLLFFVGASYFSTNIFDLYGAKGELHSTASAYFSIRSMGLPLALTTFGIFGVFRGMQNTTWAMYISISGGIINLILDIILVLGIEGVVPAYGIEGAAWASFAAQLIMFISAIIILLRKTPFNLKLGDRIHPDLKHMGTMSLNLFVRTIALNVAYFLSNRFATMYGTSQIAAHTIAMNIWLFSAFFIDGYANAGNALSGKLIGAKRYKDLYQLGKDITLIAFVIGSLLGLCYASGYSFIGTVFSQEPTTLASFGLIFFLVIISQPLNGLAFGMDGIFKGLGYMKLLRNTLVLSTFLGFVPAIYLFDYLGFGLSGIWYAFLLWMVLRAGILLIAFYKEFKPLAQ